MGLIQGIYGAGRRLWNVLTRGGSRMHRGACTVLCGATSNGRPYRDKVNSPTRLHISFR